MELKLYNTLTRTKEPFRPIDPARVGMYVCGPTVYDFAHIGNARPVIVFDVLFRLLRHLYPGEGRVKYVRNITDVDDKINARAAERGIPIRELTEETYKNFKEDVAALGCLPPTVEPRATEHIEEMKTLIERLRAADFAYVAEDHVLFHVAAMKDYGKLSNRTLDEMMAGARVEVAPYKRDPMDFVLWKPSKAGEPGWPSPLGIKTPGRPGWHIECSAMSWKHLGETFDIHGGGIDLVFPHHENELAQSRCAFHTGVMANVWMHNGFLQVEGEKMSKSLGNFITIRDLLRKKKFGGRKWRRSVIRFAMMQTHYRQPIDWTVQLLEQSEARLERWRNFVAERTVRRTNQSLMNSFFSVLIDDLNLPGAFSIVDQAVTEEQSVEDRYTVYKIMRFLKLRARTTRVSRMAEDFQKRTLEVEALSKVDWIFTLETNFKNDLLQNQLDASSALSVYLSVFSDFWKEQNVQTNRFKDYLVELDFVEEVTAKPTSVKPELVVSHLYDSLNSIRNFSTNEWENIFKTATTRPVFASGKLKPEAILIFYFDKLASLFRDRFSIRLDWSPQMLDCKTVLSKQIKPSASDFDTKVSRLIFDREQARRAKDFEESDRIRDELLKMGVVLKDNKDGTTTWEVAR